MRSLLLSPLRSPVTSTITIPGSKSYTNRALLLAALTTTPVEIQHPLLSDDTRAMIACLRDLGIEIVVDRDSILVRGSIEDVKEGGYTLHADLSANVIRFLLPLLCIVPGIKILRGGEGLNKRPIDELVCGLRQLGANITYLDREGYPPLQIASSRLQSRPITIQGGISSQYLSALLMIAPMIGGLTIRVEGTQVSRPYLEMTIESMRQFGVEVEQQDGAIYHVAGGQTYCCTCYSVEGDFSSAGYLFAIAALTRSTVTLENLNPTSVQADRRLLDVLAVMGNTITYGERSITMIGKQIQPMQLEMLDFPDQAQTLAVLLAFAQGESSLTGLQSLRFKETDRLKATAQELCKMGISTTWTENMLTLVGGVPHAASIATYGDQRMAMAFAVAGSELEGMTIQDPSVVNKTFPAFWEKLQQLGIGVQEVV